jgi:hypothetical protein
MSEARQRTENTTLREMPRPIPIDRAKLAPKTPVITAIKLPARTTVATGSIAQISASGTADAAPIAVNGGSSYFVGAKTSWAATARPPLVQTSPRLSELESMVESGKLSIMPQKAPPVLLAPPAKAEDFKWVKGIQIALTVEALGALSLYGVWHLWHLFR